MCQRGCLRGHIQGRDDPHIRAVRAMSALRPMRITDWARMWFVAFLIVMAEREYRAYVRREERRRLRG